MRLRRNDEKFDSYRAFDIRDCSNLPDLSDTYMVNNKSIECVFGCLRGVGVTSGLIRAAARPHAGASGSLSENPTEHQGGRATERLSDPRAFKSY